MTREQLNDITPREFFNTLDGYREREMNLISTLRSHAFLLLSPHFEKDSRVEPKDIWPLPSDALIEDEKKKKSEGLRIKMLRELKAKGTLPAHMEKWLEENDTGA